MAYATDGHVIKLVLNYVAHDLDNILFGKVASDFSSHVVVYWSTVLNNQIVAI